MLGVININGDKLLHESNIVICENTTPRALSIPNALKGPRGLESWEINYNFPAGKFVDLVYRIQYQNEHEGILRAVLESGSGGWELYWIDVTIPPEKLDDYVGLETRG